MDKINFTTSPSKNVPNSYNRTRKMTDEQLKQLFEQGDNPTNEDHVAIIDSKANIDEVYVKEQVDTLFSDHINGLHKQEQLIDDSNIKTDKTYSSSKIENRIANHRHDASQIDNLPTNDGSKDAKDIIYDNTTSNLKSTNVKTAIDELVVKDNEINSKVEKNISNISENKKNISNLKNKVDNGQNHKLSEDNGTVILLNIGYDLNLLRNTGMYNGNQLLNAPNNSDGWFYIEVMQHTNLNGYVYQKATTLSDFNSIRVFHREMVGNTWGSWRSL